MEKRYQVFVSSTYDDLPDERREVMQALLELECFPAGMELFSAADDDQWTYITGVIDECDYYVVIVAGRYGSVTGEGMSYTEKEYRYAIDTGKPVIGFLHENPDDIPHGKTDDDPDAQAKLVGFRELVRKKMCKSYRSPEDLGGKVTRGVLWLKKNRPAVGWVRANEVPAEDALADIVRLRRRTDELEAELAEVKSGPPKGAEDLSRGSDIIELGWTATLLGGVGSGIQGGDLGTCGKVKVTWDEIFYAISPIMIDEATDGDLEVALHAIVRGRVASGRILGTMETVIWQTIRLCKHDMQTVKVQLQVLGMMAKSPKQHSVSDPRTYWTLTGYGTKEMMRLRAVRRTDSGAATPESGTGSGERNGDDDKDKTASSGEQ